MNDPMSPDEIKGLTVYQCATIAGCLIPDSLDSPGAGFLSGVRDEVLNRWDYGVDQNRVNDVAHSIADESPDSHDHGRWEEFVDLGAYQEESPDGEWPNDLTHAAGIALYQIAQRLAESLLTSLCEWQEEQEDEEEEPCIGEHAACKHCDLDIEYTGASWHDRGGNEHCPSGELHEPHED